MKTSEFINEARDELYQGWAQNSYRTAEGSVCVLGALDRVALRTVSQGGVPARARAQKAIEQKAWEMFPDVYSGSIPGVNDHPLTSKQDMLDLLDKASLSLEEVGE